MNKNPDAVLRREIKKRGLPTLLDPVTPARMFQELSFVKWVIE